MAGSRKAESRISGNRKRQEKGKGAQRESGAFFCGRKRESFTGSFTARRCFSGWKDLRERE